MYAHTTLSDFAHALCRLTYTMQSSSPCFLKLSDILVSSDDVETTIAMLITLIMSADLKILLRSSTPSLWGRYEMHKRERRNLHGHKAIPRVAFVSAEGGANSK